MPVNANIALNLLQALSMCQKLNRDLKTLARQCVTVIVQGQLPTEQQKRFEMIRGQLDL